MSPWCVQVDVNDWGSGQILAMFTWAGFFINLAYRLICRCSSSSHNTLYNLPTVAKPKASDETLPSQSSKATGENTFPTPRGDDVELQCPPVSNENGQRHKLTDDTLLFITVTDSNSSHHSESNSSIPEVQITRQSSGS